ncbi:T-cell surface glycoprotein CD4-like isoform X1 [Dipodomys merriami]|uniref:T-cell surface glycoprotein CD4-like isoform X1 n=2 Tax=Dipodomys merriami TaxID=94247 RepID=UPI003855EE65
MSLTPAYLNKATMKQRLACAALFLALLFAVFLAVGEGKELVLGKAGQSVELPCQSSLRKNMQFIWKHKNQSKILTAAKFGLVSRGHRDWHRRFDSKKNLWDQGSFPLIISELEMRDSDSYICEVERVVTEVELQVYRLTPSPESPVMHGETLTLTLETPSNTNPSGQCRSPRNQVMRLDKVLTLPKLDVSQSGRWTCTISQKNKELQFDLDIRVLGFLQMVDTVYKAEGEPVQLSFPFNMNDESLNGELRWRAEGTSGSQSWLTFSLRSGKLLNITVPQDPKLQVPESLPIRLKLAKAQPKYAGSGNLTVKLGRRTLSQPLNLVVMTMALQGRHLVCRVLGPVSPKLHLSLHPGNQTARVSKQEKEVRVEDPEAGLWQCFLKDAAKALLQAQLEVQSALWSPGQPTFLAVVAGGALGLVVGLALFISCCVKWRRGRRQAERMSQIKRLLSEKKTCRCPHRLQKTHNLL